METVDSVVFGALALGLLVSFALAVPVAGGMLTTRRLPFIAAAGLLVAGLSWMPVYAHRADEYFTGGDVSRWEYATRDGRGAMVVAAGSVAVLALCVVGAAAVSRPGGVWRRAAMAATLGGTFALLLVWLLLTSGH